MKPEFVIVGDRMARPSGGGNTRSRATLRPDTARDETPLRLLQPVEAVVADLEGYVPELMRKAGVPGLSIADAAAGGLVATGTKHNTGRESPEAEREE